MGIDELLSKIEFIGAGADAKAIARTSDMLSNAIGLGVVDREDVDDIIACCNDVLSELRETSLIRRDGYKGISSIPNWKKYVSVNSAEAAEFKDIAKEIYKDTGNIELLIMKKALGIKAMALYNYGKLQGVFLCYNGCVANRIDDDNIAIKGIPKVIDEGRTETIRVYGALTATYSNIKKNRTGLERLAAIKLMEFLKEPGVPKLEFITEYVDDKKLDLHDRLIWAESEGFKVLDYCTVDADIYNIDEYIGERGIEQFEYDSDEYVLDSILIMLNSTSGKLMACVEKDSNFDKNIVAIKVIGGLKKQKYRTTVTGIKLEQVNGIVSVVANVEPFEKSDGEMINKIVISIDDAYNIEANNEITVTECNGIFKIVKEQ